MARFTPSELHVMQLLWEHGELKPSQIQELYPEPIKNPALRSYLTILVEKQHIARRKVGNGDGDPHLFPPARLLHAGFHVYHTGAAL